MTSTRFVSCLVLAMLCAGAHSYAAPAPDIGIVNHVTLALQIALAIKGTPQGPNYVAELVDRIRATFPGHSRAEILDALAAVKTTDYADPGAVAAAIGRVRAPFFAAAPALPIKPLPPPITLQPQQPQIAEQAHGPQPAGAATGAIPPAGTGAPEAAPQPAPQQTPRPWRVSHNEPAAIPLDQPTLYRVTIDSAFPLTAADFANVTGPVHSSGPLKTRFSYAVAELKGPPDLVTIDALSPACQAVGPGSNLSWDWSIKPKTTTPFNMNVTVKAVGSRCDDPAAQLVDVYDFSIKVQASWWETVLQWIATLNDGLKALIALGGALGALLIAWKWLPPLLKGKSS